MFISALDPGGENIIVALHPKFLDDRQVKFTARAANARNVTDHPFESGKFKIIIRSVIHSRDFTELMLI
jgi:hypothetical protein